MSTDGDITDAFDDDHLKRAIERADEEGMWKAENPDFVEPKIQELLDEFAAAQQPRRLTRSKPRKKLSRPLPPAAWQQAIVGTSAPLPMPALEGLAKPTANEFGAPVADLAAFERDLAGDTPAGIVPPATKPSPAKPAPAPVSTGSTVLQWTQSLLAAQFVFGLVTFAHALIAGWQPGLAGRWFAAGLLTGVTWNHYDAGRFLAPVLGVAFNVLLFATTSRINEPEVRIAMGMGLLLTMLSSCVIGLGNEHRHGTSRR